MPVTVVRIGNMCGQTVTVEMVSGYCVPSYISDKLYTESVVSGILWC